MTLTITHTAAEGTLIDGTAKGDGTADALRSNGWRWSRALGSWYVPHSRDREAKHHVIERTVAQLQAAGFTVAVSIDSAQRSTATVEADLMARREGRAEALDAKANRRADLAAAEADRAARALRHLPEGGEPIHVGHYSEGAHRNAIAKADAAIRRSIDADDSARRARARADIAAGANDARYAPVTVANRIEKLRAEHARISRRLEGYSRTLPGGYLDITQPATGAYAERLRGELTHVEEQRSYWQAVRDEQIAAGLVINHSRDTIQPGDRIRYVGTWCTVTRANAKSVSIIDAYGHRGTVPYTHIRDHHRPTGNGASS
ncbi:DUF3560 domain-containing protein [Microbacterium oleivorans]|uniref:DUF3560 domain-containing protein n=1 Tax=Microbacterium oleivorans TaxID=273677 RepID=UPI00080E1B75|nr:DUF3560 domain-containing protein [Microbacterium oleivorans]